MTNNERPRHLDAAAAALAITSARPRPPTPAFIEAEKARCAADPVYFINKYCQIYDNETQSWIPFTLWPFQESAIRDASLYNEQAKELVYKRIVVLKTRQIGFTWLLADAHKLWKMLFRPITEVLVFSQSDEEAIAILSEQRFKGMYERLPEWMKIPITTSSAHEFRLSNGSGMRALPEARGGDSRTVTDVVVDEADLIVDLDDLLARAEPTLGTKGQLIVIGRAVKDKPNSAFKRLYVHAKKGEGRWNKAIFIAWFEHPGRTKEWKAALDKETLERTGTLDYVHEHYPEKDTDALSARSLDKRVPPDWIRQIYQEAYPQPLPMGAPVHTGLKLYEYPIPGHTYGIGADSAGGESDGDDAVACVIDADSKRQVAVLAGKIEPTRFGDDVADLSFYFFGAPVLFELNNHGHATRAKLKERGVSLRMGMTKHGPSRNPGWLTLDWSKKYLYDTAVNVIQQAVEEARLTGDPADILIVDFTTSTQLGSIDGNTLSAPEQQHDDHSMAWALAQMCVHKGTSSMQQVPHTGLYGSKNVAPVSQTPGLDKLAELNRAALSASTAAAPDGDDGEIEDVDPEPLWIKLLRSKGR